MAVSVQIRISIGPFRWTECCGEFFSMWCVPVSQPRSEFLSLDPARTAHRDKTPLSLFHYYWYLVLFSHPSGWRVRRVISPPAGHSLTVTWILLIPTDFECPQRIWSQIRVSHSRILNLENFVNHPRIIEYLFEQYLHLDEFRVLSFPTFMSLSLSRRALSHLWACPCHFVIVSHLRPTEHLRVCIPWPPPILWVSE